MKLGYKARKSCTEVTNKQAAAVITLKAGLPWSWDCLVSFAAFPNTKKAVVNADQSAHRNLEACATMSTSVSFQYPLIQSGCITGQYLNCLSSEKRGCGG